MKEAGLDYNEDYVDHRLDSVILAIKILHLTKILLIIAYFKFPWLMRVVMILDMTIMITSSFLPLCDNANKNVFTIIILIDFTFSYCGDFWTHMCI